MSSRNNRRTGTGGPVAGRFPSFALVLVFAAAGTAAGCGFFRGDSIKVPETPLFLGESTWVLAKEAYVRLKVAPEPGAKDAGFLKRGEIVMVKARVFKKTGAGDQGRYWFLVSSGIEGWAIETDVEAFDSKEKARSAGGVE